MKHTAWLGSALVLSLAAGAMALEADGGAAQASAGITQAAAPGAHPVAGMPVAPADLTFQQAIVALRQERQSYVASFDWSQPIERITLQREYAGRMTAFDTRELELKRDWYQATGQTELLARIESALDSRRNAGRVLPEIVSERQPAPTRTPEVAK